MTPQAATPSTTRPEFLSGLTTRRWEALDQLRGLSIFFMLLHLNNGAWEHMYPWLQHIRWEGCHFIDLVAPIFLFCVGVALPLSFKRRVAKGATRGGLIRHVLVRAALLVLIGIVLNGYPHFELSHLRIPGVLQRIGLTYGIVAAFVLATMDAQGSVNVRAVAGFVAFVLVSYFVLLRWIPVPGFGAPRFDPVGSWPAVIDRAVFTRDHLFPYWPVNGRVEFDPEGLVSTWPACANVLIGVLVGAWHLAGARRPIATPLIAGGILTAAGLAFIPVCPMIKNIWTPTFVLFTCGFGLIALAALTRVESSPVMEKILSPAKIFGGNALLAFMISFLIAPLLDAAILPDRFYCIRHAGYLLFSFASPNLASLLAGLLFVALIFVPLNLCHRRRWFLKL